MQMYTSDALFETDCHNTKTIFVFLFLKMVKFGIKPITSKIQGNYFKELKQTA
jgi:hypothetical protein